MTTLNIPDMSCGHCRATVEQTVTGIDAGAKLIFDMENRKVTLDSTGDLDRILAALKGQGYEATPA